MGWANQTIDSTVSAQGWVENIKWALVTVDNSGFGFYWNLVALTLLVILILAYRDTRPQAHQNDTRPLPPVSLPKVEQPIPPALNREPREILRPASIAEKKPQMPDSSTLYSLASLLPPDIPASLTGPQATKLIAESKSISQYVHIKLCSTYEYMELARHLEDILRTAGFTFIIDEKRNECIFLAQPTHNSIVLRYCESESIRYAASVQLEASLNRAFEYRVKQSRFPEESNIDYFQIEIGGAP